MNVTKLLNEVIVKSQFFVSLCATFLGVFVWLEQKHYQFSLVVILFLTYWNGYFFIIFHRKKLTILLSGLGLIIMSFLILKYFDLQFYIKWLIILLFGALYNSDFFRIRFREISIIKTFYVGFVWALSLVWLPMDNKILLCNSTSECIQSCIKSTLQNFTNPWFFIIFFFTSAITFPFEIRDLDRDKFPTLPKKIGIQNTQYLSYFFLFLSSMLAVEFIQLDFAISIVITNIFAGILIYFTNTKRKDTYYSVLLESLSMLPFFILILIKYFC